MNNQSYTIQVNTHSKALKAYAYHLTQNNDDALDLLQETFLKAYTYQTKFSEGTNLKGWLYTIMKNTFINEYRRKSKRNTFIDSTENAFFLDQSINYLQNDGESKIILDDIQNKIDQLPVTLQQAFVMNTEGFKYQEIADHLNIPVGTVKTRIHLARKSLMKKLEVYSRMYGLNVA
jgi:RNA polymerase sigma factor (sigma-70 family)